MRGIRILGLLVVAGFLLAFALAAPVASYADDAGEAPEVETEEISEGNEGAAAEEEAAEEEAEEPFLTAEEIYEANRELLASVGEEERLWRGAVGVGATWQDNTGSSDFINRYDYPQKGAYLSRFELESKHPWRGFFDFEARTPTEKTWAGEASFLVPAGRFSIDASHEWYGVYSLYRTGTEFVNTARALDIEGSYHNSAHDRVHFGLEGGYRSLNRRNNINSQNDFSNRRVATSFSFRPHDESLVRVRADFAQLRNTATGLNRRDRWSLGADYERSLTPDTTLTGEFGYLAAETFSGGGELNRYRLGIGVLGDRAFGHDYIDYTLRFNYLTNDGDSYLGTALDNRWDLGGTLRYLSPNLGDFSFGYSFARADVTRIEMAAMPYALKMQTAPARQQVSRYWVSEAPRVHEFTVSHRVSFGREFTLSQKFNYERLYRLREATRLDARYRNLFPNRNWKYAGSLSWTPAPKWDFSLWDNLSNRKTRSRQESFFTNFATLTGSYQWDENTFLSANIGRLDYYASDPTVDIYGTDMMNWGVFVSHRFEPDLTLHASYNYSYSTGRDKFRMDDIEVGLALDGRVPLNLAYQFRQLNDRLYPQSNFKDNWFFVEYEYKF